MSRMLVTSGMCLLSLMTLAVSAQQQEGNVPQPPSTSLPLQYAQRNGMWSFGHYGSRAHREEMEYAQKSEELVKQLAKAEGDKKEKIRDELTKTLGKQFDARQKRHQEEIKALEDQVKKLKELVQKREDKRSEIISKRQEQLVREAEGLGW